MFRIFKLRNKKSYRAGIGFDAHLLKKGRPLFLGGVFIPCQKGLKGHSDGDVLLHAITDALLGALAMPDIGVLFPDTDPAYKNARSAVFLLAVSKKMRELGWQIGNVDCTLVCDRPKIAPYADLIRKNIARLLEVKIDKIGIKAKTTEGTCFAISGRSIAALVTVLIVPATK